MGFSSSKSHAAMPFGHLDKEDQLLRIQSLSCHPYLRYSSRELLPAGRTAYFARHQSYPKPSLSLLIWQCRERERTSFRRPKAYSHRDEILRWMAKLKSQEMGIEEVNKYT
jgi:hypothetical protein